MEDDDSDVSMVEDDLDDEVKDLQKGAPKLNGKRKSRADKDKKEKKEKKKSKEQSQDS